MSKFNELLIKASTKEELEEINSFVQSRLKELKENERLQSVTDLLHETISKIESGEVREVYSEIKYSYPHSRVTYVKFGATPVRRNGPLLVELNISYEVIENDIQRN